MAWLYLKAYVASQWEGLRGIVVFVIKWAQLTGELPPGSWYFPFKSRPRDGRVEAIR